MKKADFSFEMSKSLNVYDVDLRFLTNWHQEISSALRAIRNKAKGIKHPRHLGDYLEEEVGRVFAGIIPKRYSIEKGFVLNKFSAVSQEQDLLVVDTALGSALCATDGVGYYPAECVVGSVEIKSNLDLKELRKCFISCVSVKKLLFPSFDYTDAPDKRLFYAIFAYSSGCSQKSFEAELEACVAATPEPLRPNLILILDRGLYFPTSSGHIALDLDAVQRTLEGYKMIAESEVKGANPRNLSLFFGLLIEHALSQSKERLPVSYSSYLLTPTLWEGKITKEKPGALPIRKFVNRHVRLSKENRSLGVVVYEQVCDKCGALEKFFVLPPGTAKTRAKIEEDLAGLGCKHLPKDLAYTCVCGQKCEVSEAKT